MKSLRKFAPLWIPLLLVAGFVGYVAYRTRRIPTPRRRWKRFEHPDAVPLNASKATTLQGIYKIEEGSKQFGEKAVVKCSYTIEKEEQVYHITLFCEKDGTYILSEGKMQGSSLLLKGHWRKASEPGTGLAWLIADTVEAFDAETGSKGIRLQGWYGDGNTKPEKAFTLTYQHPLPDVPPLDIIAHRGGSRNVDFLSISENTTGMAKLAAQLGANGIEIDVRMTKDNVPVIFHDSFLSIHTVQDMIYGGMLHKRTLKKLKSLELRNEGEIPTLEEMLDAVLYQTPLEIVWLDIKKECDLELVRSLQEAYHEKARALDRKLSIYIGVPDQYMYNCFRNLPDYKHVPSLTELDWKTAIEMNAQVWAPQYTGGFQSEEVEKLHAEGRKAYVWSLDREFMIHAYLTEGGFDGLVTNAAPVVTYWYYTEGYKMRQEQQVTGSLQQ
ncbi:MAG TPA: glycerophosphodiester phosphodiesterase [Flavisolibacter sp.]|jgi:glycerophosphoryl diester phosphodiesterase|nr:glycerophosphodiester phosphodiesterase [Flavisolibacter sp.]